MCRAPRWCGRGLEMGALLPPGGLCAPAGFFSVTGPLQCAGPLGVLDWVTMWPCWFCDFGGLSAPWCLGLLCVDRHGRRRGSFYFYVPVFDFNAIKSPPLSTDRANFSLVLPLPDFIFLTRFLPSSFKGLSRNLLIPPVDDSRLPVYYRFGVYLNDSLTTDWTIHSYFPSLLV